MTLVKLKPFCKVFGKMAVVLASMSHVGRKPREATIFGFTSVVQIAKWLLHGFSLEAVFLLGVWQGFCRSQWRSTWKSPAKGPLSYSQDWSRVETRDHCSIFFNSSFLVLQAQSLFFSLSLLISSLSLGHVLIMHAASVV
jgi:hypothetical protein